jgi:hypothetical protein
MRNLENNKLMYFLSALPGKDIPLFRDYLHSPVFNAKEEPRRLYEHIVHECLQKGQANLDDEAAIASIWPQGDGDKGRLNKAKSALINLFTAFLEFRQWRQEAGRAKVGLLQQLNALGDQSYFEYYYRKLKAELDAAQRLDMPSLTTRLEMELAYMQHRQAFGQRSADSHLDVTQAAMEKVVHGYALRFAFVIANQRMIVGAEMPPWITHHIAQVQFEDLADAPLLEIYYLLYHTHGPSATRAQLHLLQERLLHHAAHCPAQEAMDIYTGTINNFNRYVQHSGETLLDETFAIYQSMVESVIQKQGSGLHRSHFKNIVYLGSRLGKFKWVEKFLDKGLTWLEDEGLDTIRDYNTGVLHFYKREFAAAERCFNRVLADVKDVFDAFDARMFLLMCFFETGDSQGMESLLHSFRMLLDRGERVSSQHKNYYLAFIRVFRLLISTPPHDKNRLQNLKAEVERLGAGAGKVWLLGKVG